MITVTFTCENCGFKEEKEYTGSMPGTSIEPIRFEFNPGNKDKCINMDRTIELCPDCRKKAVEELKNFFIDSKYYY